MSNSYICGYFHRESRYLLFLTENYSALQTLQHFLTSPALCESSDATWQTPYILFGSSFPKDKDFTQVMHYLASMTHSSHDT